MLELADSLFQTSWRIAAGAFFLGLTYVLVSTTANSLRRRATKQSAEPATSLEKILGLLKRSEQIAELQKLIEVEIERRNGTGVGVGDGHVVDVGGPRPVDEPPSTGG